MSNARLLTRFEIVAGSNDNLRVVHNAVTQDLTLDAGLYYWSLDDSVTAGMLDFGKHLEDKLTAAFPGRTFTVKIYGVNQTGSYADGRLYFTVDANTWYFDFANSTLSPRVLGFPTGSTSKPAAPAQTFPSEHVHRYGWYPQSSPARDLPHPMPEVHAAFTTAGYLDVVDWGEHDETIILFDNIGSPLVRPDAAAVAALAAQYNLTTGDENCAFTRWAVDAVRMGARWRYYEDITSTSFKGAYQFPEGPTWVDPLAGPSFPEDDQAEHWTISIPGRTLPAGA